MKTAVVLLVLVALIAGQAAAAAIYTEDVTAGCKNSKKCSSALLIQGGAGWTGPANRIDICAGKPQNALVVDFLGQLVLCVRDAAQGKLVPFPLLGTLNEPNYLLTTKTIVSKGGCHYYTYTGGNDLKATNNRLKDRIYQLEIQWGLYDQLCAEEYGSEYVAATMEDSLFAINGAAAPLDARLNTPKLSWGVYNVRGGYFTRYATDVENSPNNNRWGIYPVFSDCYGGQASSRLTKITGPGDTVCPAPEFNPAWDGFVADGIDLPGYNPTPGPVLCRRRDVTVQSLYAPGYSQREIRAGKVNPTCQSLLGKKYKAADVYDLLFRTTASYGFPFVNEAIFSEFSITGEFDCGNTFGMFPYIDSNTNKNIIFGQLPRGCDVANIKLTCSTGPGVQPCLTDRKSVV